MAESDPFLLQSPDGLTLRGEVWGATSPAEPPQWTFLHGTGLVVESYFAAFRPLLERVRVHALNSRGHGGSDVPADLPGWEVFLEDLRHLILSRLEPPVVLCGHSYGALLSIQLAAQMPHLVTGLVLLDPLAIRPRDEEWPETTAGQNREFIERTRTRRGDWASREEAHDWLRKRGVYRDWRDEPYDAFLAAGLRDKAEGGVTLACPPWLEADIYAGRPGKEIFDWAEQVSAPAVILRGRDSPLSLGAEDLADAFPVGVVLEVKGGHTFPQEFPRETGQALEMARAILAKGIATRLRSD